MFECLRRSNFKLSKLGKYRRMFILSTTLFTILFLILLHRQVQNTLTTMKYNDLVTFQLHPFWKNAAKEQVEGQKEKKDKGDESPELLVNSTKVKVTRQELGHNSWQLLHMISGTIPDHFNDDFKYKINAFLNLFGQFYPCKVCATHFLEHTKDFQFTGNTKKQFMKYMCELHNVVNQAVGHPQYDCSNIAEEWDSCGCSSGKPKAK